MEKEGYLVCNYLKSYLLMVGIIDFEKFKEEIISVEKVYKDVIGKEMFKYFRFLMGKFSE